MRFIKYYLLALCLIASKFGSPQEGIVYKTIFTDDFNDNSNNWHTEWSTLRKSSIVGGKLIDGFYQKDKGQSNRVSVNFEKGKNYELSFDITSLNNDASLQYPVYEMKKNGKLVDSRELTPDWGIVWGYKDWNNYNCLRFYNGRKYNHYRSEWTLYTAVLLYYVHNGEKTILENWKKYQSIGSKEINIKVCQRNGTDVEILVNDNQAYSFSGGTFKWYGNQIGTYIGGGAKIALNKVTLKEILPHPRTYYSESSLKKEWKDFGIDYLEGIYEVAVTNSNTPKYRLGLKKTEKGYSLIYLSGASNPGWKTGEIKAFLTATATPNMFKVGYFMGDKSYTEDLYAFFDPGSMKLIWQDGRENLYFKLYPASDGSDFGEGFSKSSGTGFAISSDGYIVTNNHVTEGASTITVRGIKGDFSKSYNAEIVITDKNSDLSIIQIEDNKFTSLGQIPYTIDMNQADVGSSVYSLGYPMLATMGDEVKLTNGIISSKTGFQGDISTYQSTVAVQPGNSGGPLFNNKGNVIGIINAKHSEAENASYAIKTNYLENLFNVMDVKPKIPTANLISGKSLSEQVKFSKEFVYIIEVN